MSESFSTRSICPPTKHHLTFSLPKPGSRLARVPVRPSLKSLFHQTLLKRKILSQQISPLFPPLRGFQHSPCPPNFPLYFDQERHDPHLSMRLPPPTGWDGTEVFLVAFPENRILAIPRTLVIPTLSFFLASRWNRSSSQLKVPSRPTGRTEQRPPTPFSDDGSVEFFRRFLPLPPIFFAFLDRPLQRRLFILSRFKWHLFLAQPWAAHKCI